ncbi:DUF3427 domain-containing protein [Vogesella indigofera]|uniref:DUF3427 domain-containing protein n=1 Tax=Vogesella indigofera TaxID=45465 RepID=A0ABT5I875_VOGIN|nr:DUF3427 domain-containing protein [Vogesella indigofera]MDC7692385.1 DUF3427 domain-containing protein [Vogesella indigofera]
MSMLLPDGLYDLLLDADLQQQLSQSTRPDQASVTPLDVSDSHQRLLDGLSEQLAGILLDLQPSVDEQEDDHAVSLNPRVQVQLSLINELIVSLRQRLQQRYPESDLVNNLHPFPAQPQRLTAIHRQQSAPSLPDTGVLAPWLFTAAKASPALLHELRHELASSNRIDILMSFITVSGVRKIADILRSITALDGSGKARTTLRILTTTYIGATEVKALDELARLPGCEVRVSLDGRRTRLHAKAWIFERDSGFGTAYVGSANLTQAALAGGLEWTVKFTQRGQEAMFRQAQANFETLWHDKEFVHYHPDQAGHREALIHAIAKEKGEYPRQDAANILSFFELTPKPYQQDMLEQLQLEREHRRFRNLVVAATGTGKTVVAAFDYQNICRQYGGRPKLLFIAHRVEILQQALRTYREVLRDPSFGQMLGGGVQSDCPDHLFVTIDSLHSQDLVSRYGEQFWHTIVFDECHRLAADTFDSIARRVRPTILLGLTATPERSDGKPISRYFDSRPDGSPAVEMRLWHALDLELLAPFEYFACDDETDLSQVPWHQSGEVGAIDKALSENEARARLVIHEWHRLCANPKQSKAIAFCVSIKHAQFMTQQFNEAGLPALCLSSESSKEERASAPLKLAAGEVSVLVTVDLYNEGVDLPMVDTLLLLRPTQSAVLFQQQIGRGLRLHKGKESCLILDFVGQHNREYRFDHLLAQLTGHNRRQLINDVEHGFSQLPPGCHIQLQKRSRDQVLNSLRHLIQQNWRRLIRELQSYISLHGRQNLTLPRFLHDQALDIADLYRGSGNSGWTALQRSAGLIQDPITDEEEYFGRRFSDLLHTDDPEHIDLIASLPLNDPKVIRDNPRLTLRLQMLAYQVDGTSARIGSGLDFLARLQANPHCLDELKQLVLVLASKPTPIFHPIPGLKDVPLCLHAHYRIREILTAVAYLNATARPRFGEGVLRLQARKSELLFVTLNKSEGFHEAIAYHDYAISPTLFHWQTQNSCSPHSKTGKQYLESVGPQANGWQFQLFVRTDKDSAYMACGPVVLQSSRGSQPMSIEWQLEVPLPAAAFSRFSVLRGA